MGSYEPHSIPTLLKRNAEEAGNLPAMKTKDPKTGDEVHLILINHFDFEAFLKKLNWKECFCESFAML